MAASSTNLFVAGLPAEFTEDHVKACIGQYGIVQAVKILPPQPGNNDSACLCEMTTPEESLWIVENLNGNIPQGLTNPISVRFAQSSKGGKGGPIVIPPSFGKGVGGGGGADPRFAPYAGGAAAGMNGMVASRQTGTIGEDKGKFGFIKQDSGDKDMFCMAPLPPMGTRVVYDVISDPRTGRLRADNVQPADGSAIAPAAAAMMGGGFPGGGAAAMAGGGLDWTQLSAACGGLMADGGMGGVGGFGGCGGVPGFGMTTMSPGAAKNTVLPTTTPTEALLTGCLAYNKGQFGFIKQDNGDADMFCMPQSCVAFGKVLPEIGTRITYKVVIDQKTGRPRADGVAPAMM